MWRTDKFKKPVMFTLIIKQKNPRNTSVTETNWVLRWHDYYKSLLYNMRLVWSLWLCHLVSILFFVNWLKSLLYIILSSILEKHGRTDTGLHLPSSLASPPLNIGVLRGILTYQEKIPLSKDRLNIRNNSSSNW